MGELHEEVVRESLSAYTLDLYEALRESCSAYTNDVKKLLNAQKDYIEALEKTVMKVAEALFDMCDGHSPFDLMDITGFCLETCEEMKKLANAFPRKRDHVKDFVRKAIG